VLGRLVAQGRDVLGRRSCLSPSIVAWATLMPLGEPSDLAMMSFTPAISRIARAAPPAMTPVPGAAASSAPDQHPSANDGIDNGRARNGHVKEVLARLFDTLLHGESASFALP